jgi:hypothetical protein
MFQNFRPWSYVEVSVIIAFAICLVLLATQ